MNDLHLVVGVAGKTGEGIIQEANGLSLLLRRPLRDLWHQVPGVEMTIKVSECLSEGVSMWPWLR